MEAFHCFAANSSPCLSIIMDQICQGCSVQQATRMCLSCDPTGQAPVYLCLDCTNRAHFGPMKFSHHVKSLINLKTKEKLLESHKIWSNGETENLGLCISELEGSVNDLENQKRVDLEIMNATFEPLKNAVINRKRELTAQIAAHYDSMKPRLSESIIRCKQQCNIAHKMNPFDTSSIEGLLPTLDDGHRVVFPADWNLDIVLNNILSCQLKTEPTEITDEIVKCLNFAPGDIFEVFSNQMDKDGIFWLKLIVPAEYSSPLYLLAFQCRQRLILGKATLYSEHPHDLHTGMVVMMKHPEDGVWYRAIVTDPCVKDQETRPGGFLASVVVADSGYKLDVPHSRLSPCTPEDVSMPFLAVPCSLYPGDHAPIGVEPRWLYNDLIKTEKKKYKPFSAKFVHKKTAKHVVVPVWYVELTDLMNPSVSVNQQMEEKRDLCSSGKGSIQHQDIRIKTGEIANSKVEICIVKPKQDGERLTPPQKIAGNTGPASPVLPGAHVTPLKYLVKAGNEPNTSYVIPQKQTSREISFNKLGADGDTSNLHQTIDKSKSVSAAGDVSEEHQAGAGPDAPLAHSMKENLPAMNNHSAENAPKDIPCDSQVLPPSTSRCSVDDSLTVTNCPPAAQIHPVNKSSSPADAATVGGDTLAGSEVVSDAQTVTITVTESTPEHQPSQSTSMFRPTPSIESGGAVTCADLESGLSLSTGSSSPASEVAEGPVDISSRDISSRDILSRDISSRGSAEGNAKSSSEGNESLNRKSKKKKRKSLTHRGNVGAENWESRRTGGRVSPREMGGRVSPRETGRVSPLQRQAFIAPSQSSQSTSSRPLTPALSDSCVDYTTHKAHKVFTQPTKPGVGSLSDTSANGVTSAKPRGAVISGQNAIINWIKSPGRMEARLPPLPLDVSLSPESPGSGVAGSRPGNATDSSPPSVGSLGESAAGLTSTTPEAFDDDPWQECVSPVKSFADPSLPPAICSRCNVEGHTSDQCFSCSSIVETSQLNQNHSQQPNIPNCVLCGGPHSAPSCPNAKMMYMTGGCPYCLTRTHMMHSCQDFKRRPVSERIPFHFIINKSAKKSGKRPSRGRANRY